jgi:hypothetical protein
MNIISSVTQKFNIKDAILHSQLWELGHNKINYYFNIFGWLERIHFFGIEGIQMNIISSSTQKFNIKGLYYIHNFGIECHLQDFYSIVSKVGVCMPTI